MAKGPNTTYAEATARAVAEANAAVEALKPPPDPRTPAQKAEVLRQQGAACYLFAAACQVVGETFDIPTWKVFLDRFLREAGDSADPVERLLLEQLVLAHHTLGRLHARAGARDGSEEVKAYLGAIARLLAEVRRTALALKTYREAAGPRKADAESPVEQEGPAEERQPREENHSPKDEQGGRGVNQEQDPVHGFPVPARCPLNP